MKKVLAFDFGASSGRAIIGAFDGEKIELSEVHRFNNDPVMLDGKFYWDFLRLFFDIKKGLTLAPRDFESIGIDTWGVDYGLLDKDGELIGNPRHYRDERTSGKIDEAARLLGAEYIYSRTGIQTIWFNTIYQLMTEKNFNRAKSLLMIPDLMNYFLTGEKRTEYTIATTTQLYNPVDEQFDAELMKKLNIPNLFPPMIDAGEVVGTLKADIAEELGVPRVPIIAVAEHDTGSAVASVPFDNPDTAAYISCGTWSLMGTELSSPCITEKARELNYTNEGGVGHTTRFLKNIMGLWIVNECMRQWEREGTPADFKELDPQTEAAEGFKSFIDPDDEVFATPGNMPERIRSFCSAHGMPAPQTKAEIMRCIVDSLALKYRYTLEGMEEILGKKLDTVHMVGGGIKNKLLCRLTADVTGRRVVAGPIEATAMGNVAVQLIALGEIKDLSEARRVIKRSFDAVEYTPQNIDGIDEIYDKFKTVLQ